MYYFPMDFEKLTLDGLIDTGALTSAISEEDLNKIKLLSNEAIKDTGPAPNFQIIVANGQLERPIDTRLTSIRSSRFPISKELHCHEGTTQPINRPVFFTKTQRHV